MGNDDTATAAAKWAEETLATFGIPTFADEYLRQLRTAFLAGEIAGLDYARQVMKRKAA